MPVLGVSLAPWILRRPALVKMLKPVVNIYVNQAGWRKIGLRYDDLIEEENPTVKKALTRLSTEESYARSFRLKRAIQQSILHTDLPKDQWTKPEEDVPYLTPLIEEVMKEEDERFELDNLVVQRRMPGTASAAHH